MKVLKMIHTSVFLTFALLIGCAKELPQELPDSVQPNVFGMSEARNGHITIKTKSAPSEKAVQTNDSSISGFFALNEKSLYPIQVVRDTTGLGKLLHGMKIEASAPGVTYKVKFKIAQSKLVAFIQRPDASIHMIDMVDSNNMVPLFEFPISGFGIIEAVKNSLGEDTKTLTFTSRSRAGATHIMIDPTAENRTLAGLRKLDITDKVQYLAKNKVHQKIISANSIKNLFPNGNIFTEIVAHKFKLHVFKDRLYFLKASSYQELNAVEKVAFKNENDSRISSCDKNETLSFQKELGSCFWKPIGYVGLTHTKIIRTIDDYGVATAEANIVHDVNPTNSHIIKVDLNEKISEGLYFDQLVSDKKFHEKSELHQQTMSIAEVQATFPNHAALDLLPNKNVNSMKLFIFKNKLYFLTPKANKSLNPIEKLALKEANDPRIFKCSVDEAKDNSISKNNCVWTPQSSISLGHVKIDTNLKEDEYTIPGSNFTYGVDPKKSDVVYITFDEQLNLDYIGQNITTKDKIFTSKKSHYDISKKYLYVPMTLGTPREVPSAAPFFQGNERIVYMKWVKEGLQIFEKDKDFDTSINEKPVMTIGGQFIDFKCQDESDANCNAIEVIDNKVSEEKARFFIPNLEQVAFTQLNTLDLYYLDSDPCVITKGKKLIDYTIQKGVINFQIEKEYYLSTNFSCVINNFYKDTTNFNGLATTGFKVQYFYSIVEMDNLVSKDYETITYPKEDHGIYGFFKDREETLNDDFSDTTEEFYLSRWNPKKKTITYHLSDSYNEPGQELIKKATYDSVAQINHGLRMANSGLQIEVKEPSGKLPGDLRYNVLQLITDPLANGLLGYAPTVTNPETGEIVQGHINMYAGVLRTTSSWVWDQMVQLSQDKNKKPSTNEVRDIEVLLEQFKPTTDDADVSDVADVSDNNAADDSATATEASTAVKINGNSKKLTKLFASYHKNLKLEKSKVQKLVTKMKRVQKANLQKVKPIDMRKADELSELERRLQFFEKRLDWYSKNNAYSVEAFKIASTVKEILPGIDKISGVFKTDGTLKDWKELSKTQKKEAMDIIIVYSYTSTFVHEFGHNLGLRHNFSGSFDKKNFYTSDEMKKVWPKSLSSQVPAYSSIMDYAFSTLNEATVFGKYDLAALRFAYAREVESESGKAIAVTGSMRAMQDSMKSKASAFTAQATAARAAGDEEAAKQFEQQANDSTLKEYAFCTDENAGTGLTCNRFDEGTSLTEIVQHKIDKYKAYYKYRNQRRDKKSFSKTSLGGYLVARFYEFIEIRQAFEEWESFVDFLSEDLMVMGCTPDLFKQYPDFCLMIEDRKNAVKLAGDFFIDIAKEPEASCVTTNPTDPTVGIQIKTLYSIYDEVKFDLGYAPKSCYDQGIVDQLASTGEVVLAEAGRYLNSFNDSNPKFTYTTDIAVRGIWVDKMLAMKSLFQRKESMFTEDSVHKALIDHPEFSEKVSNLIKHMVLGEPLQNGTLFTDDKGNKYRVNYQLDAISKIEAPHPSVEWVASFLDVPNSGTANVTKAMLSNAYNWGLTTPDTAFLNQSLEWINQFAVYKWDRTETFDDTGLAVEKINGINYGGAPDENAFVFEILQNSNGYDFLSKVDPQLILKVYQRRSTKPVCEVPPADDDTVDDTVDAGDDSAADDVADTGDDSASDDVAGDDADVTPPTDSDTATAENDDDAGDTSGDVADDTSGDDTVITDPVEPEFCVNAGTNEELAWDIEQNLLEALVGLRIQGVPLTLAQLTPQFGEAKAKEILEVYKLEAIQMQMILQERIARQTAPQGADDVENNLYTLSEAQLLDFLSGNLEAKVKRQLPKLELLPEIFIAQ